MTDLKRCKDCTLFIPKSGSVCCKACQSDNTASQGVAIVLIAFFVLIVFSFLQ